MNAQTTDLLVYTRCRFTHPKMFVAVKHALKTTYPDVEGN